MRYLVIAVLVSGCGVGGPSRPGGGAAIVRLGEACQGQTLGCYAAQFADSTAGGAIRDGSAGAICSDGGVFVADPACPLSAERQCTYDPAQSTQACGSGWTRTTAAGDQRRCPIAERALVGDQCAVAWSTACDAAGSGRNTCSSGAWATDGSCDAGWCL